MRAKRFVARAGIALLATTVSLALTACGDDDDGGTFGVGDPGGAATEPGDLDDLGDAADTGNPPAGDPGSSAERPPGAPVPPGEVLGVCELLERAEVEEQFGDLGAVAEGETTNMGCDWNVGETPDDGFGIGSALTLQFMFHPDEDLELFFNDAQWADGLAEVRSRPGVIDVPGVADDAVIDWGTLYVQSGEIVIAVGAFTIPDSGVGTDALLAKLVTLAELAIGRL